MQGFERSRRRSGDMGVPSPPMKPAGFTTRGTSALEGSAHARRRSSSAVQVMLDMPGLEGVGLLASGSDRDSEDEDKVQTGSKRKPRHGVKRWQHDRHRRRCQGLRRIAGTTLRCIVLLALLLVTLAVGWYLGRKTSFKLSDLTLAKMQRMGLEWVHPELHNSTTSTRCNPYEQHGVLLVDSKVPANNKWSPIDPSEGCQPVDYMTLLGLPDTLRELSFVKNRTIVLFGDSVDREHNEQICNLVGGKLTMIGRDDPMSPPVPKGETPASDYVHVGNSRDFNNNDQSRPHLCTVAKYGLKILSVFHYGFRSEEPWILAHQQYYPPALIEDRFTHIVLPLLEEVSPDSPRPDLFSITPGFFGLLRQVAEDDQKKADLKRKGKLTPKLEQELDALSQMSGERRQWMASRMKETLKAVASAWPVDPESSAVKPKMLWRTLHHIKPIRNIPFHRMHTVDEIGERVVEEMIEESAAASGGVKAWIAWLKRVKVGRWSLGKPEEKEPEALSWGFESRLKIDNWGKLMLGQENAFKDSVHPHPLPGSWLYGNMLLHNLKEAVTEWNEMGL